MTTAVPPEYARLGNQIDRLGPIESDLLEATWTAQLDPMVADLRRWDRNQVGILVQAIDSMEFATLAISKIPYSAWS